MEKTADRSPTKTKESPFSNIYFIGCIAALMLATIQLTTNSLKWALAYGVTATALFLLWLIKYLKSPKQ